MSRVLGNLHARFLGGKGAEMLLTYPTAAQDSVGGLQEDNRVSTDRIAA